MKRFRLSLTAAACAALAVASAGLAATPGAQAQAFGYNHLNKVQQRHVSGLLSTVLDGEDAGARARSAAPLHPAAPSAAAYQPGPHGCPRHYGANVKVNQNCLNITDTDLQGRGQAQNETWIAADPRNPRHLVASYNDYRRGDGTCGLSFSLDGGSTWADDTTPNGFTRGTAFGGTARQYWQASGDTSVAWDTKGNAYLSCQVFNRGTVASANPDQSSAFYVYRSTGNAGGSWNFPGRPVAERSDLPGAGNFLLDKQLITVDATVGSRYQDRVYVTWTTFADDGTAYIYEAFSADYGESFSAPVLVSADTAMCDRTYNLPTPAGRCNSNQFSQPFTAPDGTLYVTWANYNTAVSGTENRFQTLLAGSTDGGRTFSAPVRVGYFYELPDCATYQGGLDPGVNCIPEKGSTTNSIFRASNYPIGAVDPRHGNRVVITYGSYINRNSNESSGCRPAGFSATTALSLYDGVKDGGCNNDIVLSVSADGGLAFTGGSIDPRALPVATDAPGQRRSDQYFQGAAFSPGGRLAVSYYDRQYGSDEATGYSDVSVSASADLASFTYTRATTASLPPPTQFSGTFYGDYTGLAVTRDSVFPLWSDTRPADLFPCPGTGTPGSPPSVCTGSAANAPVANDEDIYTTRVPLR
jgi:hypothetical protein